MNIYFGFYVKFFYRWRMWACKSETIYFSPLKLHPINFWSITYSGAIHSAIAYSVQNNWREIKTLPDWYKFFSMLLGFKPIRSVYFQFDGVTRDKKSNFDKFPTLHHEVFSTNASTSCRIPTVMWKIWFPNVHYKSLNEIHYVPSNEGKIRTDGYLLSYF